MKSFPPAGPMRRWVAEADDEHLRNIVDYVFEKYGRENIGSFWLVGHSQGGLTSNRIVRTDFFRDKVDGWLSLSGGRLGGNPGRAAMFGPPRAPAAATPAAGAASAGTPGAAARPATSDIAAAAAALRN